MKTATLGTQPFGKTAIWGNNHLEKQPTFRKRPLREHTVPFGKMTTSRKQHLWKHNHLGKQLKPFGKATGNNNCGKTVLWENDNSGA